MRWLAFSLFSPPLSESGDAAKPTDVPRQGGRVSVLLRVVGWPRMSSDTKTKWSLVMKVFTTGQVAKICKVAPRTVSKWFDSGRLKGYRIPGSQDRRIPREYLIKFLKEHGMPLGDLEDEAMAKVLLVGQDQLLIENLKRHLPAENSFKIQLIFMILQYKLIDNHRDHKKDKILYKPMPHILAERMLPLV